MAQVVEKLPLSLVLASAGLGCECVLEECVLNPKMLSIYHMDVLQSGLHEETSRRSSASGKQLHFCNIEARGGAGVERPLTRRDISDIFSDILQGGGQGQVLENVM